MFLKVQSSQDNVMLDSLKQVGYTYTRTRSHLYTYLHIYIHTYTQTDRLTDRQTDRQTDRELSQVYLQL